MKILKYANYKPNINQFMTEWPIRSNKWKYSHNAQQRCSLRRCFRPYRRCSQCCFCYIGDVSHEPCSIQRLLLQTLVLLSNCWCGPFQSSITFQNWMEQYQKLIPMSSISGAIRSVTPTSNKHMMSNKQAVAIIVHRARCGRSSWSITYIWWNSFRNLSGFFLQFYTDTVYTSRTYVEKK